MTSGGAESTCPPTEDVKKDLVIGGEDDTCPPARSTPTTGEEDTEDEDFWEDCWEIAMEEVRKYEEGRRDPIMNVKEDQEDTAPLRTSQNKEDLSRIVVEDDKEDDWEHDPKKLSVRNQAKKEDKARDDHPGPPTLDGGRGGVRVPDVD